MLEFQHEKVQYLGMGNGPSSLCYLSAVFADRAIRIPLDLCACCNRQLFCLPFFDVLLLPMLVRVSQVSPRIYMISDELLEHLCFCKSKSSSVSESLVLTHQGSLPEFFYPTIELALRQLLLLRSTRRVIHMSNQASKLVCNLGTVFDSRARPGINLP